MDPLKIASTVNEHLKRLRLEKVCKRNEWTVMAAIVDDDYNVIAMGCGVKCVPECKLTYKRLSSSTVRLPLYKDTVRDMHAEVVCRRAFIRYLLSNREQFSKKKKFHFYCTKAPCGACSMPDDESPDPLDINIELGEVMRGRCDYSNQISLRTKPGRADAPFAKSMSCSDKMAIWNMIGWQGRYLHDHTVFMDSIVIDDAAAYHEKVSFGLFGRFAHEASDMEWSKPMVHCISSGLFPYKQDINRTVPMSISLVWLDSRDERERWEAIADGRRLGSAKPVNGVLKASSRSIISSSELSLLLASNVQEHEPEETYKARKDSVMEKFFKGWPRARNLYPTGAHDSEAVGAESCRGDEPDIA